MWTLSLSKVPSRVGISIMIHALPSVYRLMLSTYRRSIRKLLPCVFQWLTTKIICYPYEEVQWYYYLRIKVEGCNAPKCHCLTVMMMESNTWIISVIWFHLVFMILLWKMRSFLSWDFSPILFNSGSPISVFCGLRMYA